MQEQRPDFSEDIQAQLTKIEALRREMVDFERYWREARYGYRDFEQIQNIDNFKDRIALDQVYGEGKQQVIDIKLACGRIFDTANYPTITAFVNDLNTWLITTFIETEKIMENSREVYKKYSQTIFCIREFFDLYEDQKKVISGVLNSFITSVKQTTQFLKENGLVDMKKDGNVVYNYGSMIMSSGDHNNISLNSTVTKGDENALRNVLRKSELQEDYIEYLVSTVNSQKDVAKTNALTPAINSAIYTITEKAIDGVWSLPFAVAGNFLTDAIKLYLGIK